MSDKGIRMGVTDLSFYREKMRAHTKSYVDKKFTAKTLISNMRETSANQKLRITINKHLNNDSGFKNLCFSLTFEPFVISRIYDHFEIHKAEKTIRPISSSTICMVNIYRNGF